MPANINIQSIPVFQPYTFDQYIAPLTKYKEEYDKIEADYNTLEAQASVLESLAADAPNSKAYRDYRNYIDGLRQEAAEFAYNGLNPGSRQRLGAMRSAYATNIIPILKGVDKWSKQIERYNNLKSYERLNIGDPNKMGPDAFIGKNPSSRIIDLNDLYTKSAQQGAAQSARQQSLYTQPYGQLVLDEEFWYINKINGYINGTEELDREITNANDLMNALVQQRAEEGFSVTSAGQEALYHLLQGVELDDLTDSVKKEALSYTIAGYISGLQGEIVDNFLGRHVQSGAGGNDDTTGTGITSINAGDNVEANRDFIQQMDQNLEALDVYENGLSDPSVYDWNPNTDAAFIALNNQLSYLQNQSIQSPGAIEAHARRMVIYRNEQLQRNESRRLENQNQIQDLLIQYDLQDLDINVALPKLRQILNNERTMAAQSYPYRTSNAQDPRAMLNRMNTYVNNTDAMFNRRGNSDTDYMFTYNRNRKSSVNKDTYIERINNPGTSISIATNIFDPNDPKYGCIILKTSGESDIYINSDVFNQIQVYTNLTRNNNVPVPSAINELLPATSSVSLNDYLNTALNIYNVYRQYWIRNYDPNTDSVQWNAPTVLLNTMLDDVFVALRASTAARHQSPSTSSSDENL